jgi:hypothetical protein
MRQIATVLLFALSASLNLAQQRHFSDVEHTAEHNDTLVNIQTIHPGMTGADLNKLFTIEGGFHGGPLTHKLYQYRQCGFIKVDVEVDVKGIITRISGPYLERPRHAAD